MPRLTRASLFLAFFFIQGLSALGLSGLEEVNPQYQIVAGPIRFQEPYVIAHRGASGQLPEHTIAAYQRAIEQGAHFIECDVVLTQDLHPICRHEPNLIATTDAAEKFPDRWRNRTIDGAVVEGVFACDLTLQEVESLRVRQRWPFRDQSYNGQFYVATLKQFLDIALEAPRTVGIYPEAKHPSWHNSLPALAEAGTRMEDILLAALHKQGYSGPTSSDLWLARPSFIQCFEPTSLEYMSTKSTIPLVLLLGGWAGFVTPDTGVTHEEEVSDASLSALSKFIVGAGPWKDSLLTGGTAGGQLHSSGLAERLQAHGLQVHPYTVRDESRFVMAPFAGSVQAELSHLFQVLKVQGAFSDFPLTLHSFLAANATQQPQMLALEP